MGAGLLSPWFAIREVAVAGTVRIEPEEIRAATGLLGTNAFLASAADAAARLRALPALRGARVSVLLPDRAEVQVDERRPAIVLASGGARLFVDDDGTLFLVSGGESRYAVLQDETARHVPGERIAEELVDATRAIAALQPAFFGRAVEHVRLTAAFGLIIDLERGTQVRVGTAEQLDLKLEAARRVVLARTGKRLDYVDVRSLEGIAYFPTD